MMIVNISHEPEFLPGRPHRLFEANNQYFRDRKGPVFDIAPDGQKFVLIHNVMAAPETGLNVILN